jgi:DNA-binding beta-propeller fold protein YncE
VQTVVRLLPMLVPPMAAVGLATWHVRRRDRAGGSLPVFSTPTDIAILLGTLILPWLSPFLIDALGYTPLDYSFPVGILRSLSVVAAMAGLAIAVGVWWDWRRWLPAAGIFYAIFILFFTTFFTNGKGWATGLVGSLGYWLSQQEVARGSQPWFYYLLIVPLYEFLPLILSIPVVFAALLRRNRLSTVLLILLLITTALSLITGGLVQPTGEEEANSLLETADLLLRSAALLLAALAVTWGGIVRYPQRREHFLAFLPLWVVGTWFAYTIAGEKMPWLTTHIALPMTIAGGWWLGKVVERIDWRAVWRRGGAWIAVLMLPLLAAVVALLRSSPFRDRTIDGLSQTSQWIAALVIGGVVLGLLLRQARRVGWRDALRVAGLTIVLLLGLWSLRTSYMLNFINYDYVSEYLFYAHASPDPRMVMDQLEDMSRRTAGDKQLKIAHDDDSGWPFNWYLRNWPGATYFGANPSREVLTGATAVLIGSKNLEQARPYLARDYYEFSHRLIWWPDEGYKSASWEKIWQGLTDPVKRQEFLDVVIWRKHPQSLAEWPLVHRFSLFVRKDVAAQLWDFGAQPAAAAPLTDPYEAGMREIASLQQIGSGPGVEPGQLSFPRNVAVAGDGTLFVADSGNHRIAVYGTDGTFLRTWGSSCDLYAEGQPGCVDPDGSGPLQVGDGQLREPWGIAVGPDGRIYVADTWNHRVVVFDQEGNFLNKWGTFATTEGEAIGSPGAFWGPRAIAVDSVGNLFVTDTGNKRIQVFDAEGTFLGQFGGGGVVEGRFDEPVGLDIVPAEQGAPGGTLFVADTWNRRVQAFEVSFADELSGGIAQPSFVFLREWPVEGWASQSVVNKPYLAVDGEGFVYVTDPENWRVVVFDDQGSFRATFGMYGTDAQSFALPVGIATGPDDRAYVVDSDNHRVQVYEPVR